MRNIAVVCTVFLLIVCANLQVQASDTSCTGTFTAYDPNWGASVSFTSPSPGNNTWRDIDNQTLEITVSNDLDETMNVSFYWYGNGTLIGTDTNVVNNSVATIESGFNYTNYANYTWNITVKSDTFDNKSTFWKFRGEAYDWDINRDVEVDINDITATTAHYGETSTPGWIRQDCAPLGNPDGEIDIKDITLITAHYGEEY